MTDPGATPGFVYRGDSRPMESFYETPRDPSVWSCCLKAIVVERIEFTWKTVCPVHGERCGGNAD